MTGAATDLRLLPFGPEHIRGALALSRAAGWPHRAEDWALTLAISEGVVAVEGGEVVGTALCTGFGGVAALNMIIVAEGLRGRGLGRRLMEAVIALAGPREQRLVATAEGLPLYRKLGFGDCGRVLQHQGIARPAPPDLPVQGGGAVDLPGFVAADLDASGMARGDLLARIAGAGKLLVADGGFAALRPFGRGHVLGPVVARDAATARALIAAGATRQAGSFLRIDLPETVGLSGLAEDLGLARSGGGVCMVRNGHPRRHGSFTTFALASQALG